MFHCRYFYLIALLFLCVLIKPAERQAVYFELTDSLRGSVRTELGITSFAISPDGTRIAFTTMDGNVAVTDSKTGRLIGVNRTGERATVEFSSDGKWIGTYSTIGFRLFDADLKMLAREHPDQTGLANRSPYLTHPLCHLLPGLKVAWYRSGKDLILFRPDSGRWIERITLHHDDATITHSADGNRLAILDAEFDHPAQLHAIICGKIGRKELPQLTVIETETAKPVICLEIKSFSPSGFGMNRDGSLAAVNGHEVTQSQQLLSILNMKTGTQVGQFRRSADALFMSLANERETIEEYKAIALSPDGKRVAVALSIARNDSEYSIIDVKSGMEVKRFIKSKSDLPVKFSQDGQSLYYSNSDGIRRLEME